MRASWLRRSASFPLPIEVVRFGLLATMRLVEAIAAEAGLPRRDQAQARARATRRSSPTRAISSSIAPSARIPEPEVLAFSLKRVPGVVEHGLFLGLADLAIVAGKRRRQSCCAAQEPDAKWLSTTTICSSSARARAGSARRGLPPSSARKRRHRRGIPHRRHLRDPRLRAEEVAGLWQPLRHRVSRCARLRLDLRWPRIRLADVDRQRQARGRPA